ncbi:hypothetical protein CVT26_008738, partial [Gymnopilus dilepis]
MAKPTPTAPTLTLPPLTKLSSHSPSQIQSALANLRALYFPSASSSARIRSGDGAGSASEETRPESKTILDTDSSHLTLPKPKRVIQHPIHDTSVPDSGYASAEEEDEDEQVLDSDTDEDDRGGDSYLSILRADPLERAYATKWVTGLVARSDVWLEGAGSSSSQGRKDNSEDAEDSNDDEDTRLSILDEATALLSAFSRASVDDEEDGEGEEDASLTRTFSFPLCLGTENSSRSCTSTDAGTGSRLDNANPNPSPKTIEVQLNDAPLSSTDHTSVGLQSWGSSIVLAERMCASPGVFLPKITCTSSKANRKAKDVNNEDKDKKEKEEEEGEEDTPLRILELGAGTGMLSIVAAKILGLDGTRPHGGQADVQGKVPEEVEVVATDYHPDVLANLRKNVETNFPSSPSSSPSSSAPLLEKEQPIQVHALDWSSPPIPSSSPSSSSTASSSSSSCAPGPGPKPKKPFDKPFDLILAADVIYHPQHAEWIRGCVEGMLRKPQRQPSSPAALKSPSTAEMEHAALQSQDQGGTFWLIIPLRTTGRHAGMDASVEGVFPDVSCLHPCSKRSSQGKVKGAEQGQREMRLAVLHREDIPRK